MIVTKRNKEEIVIVMNEDEAETIIAVLSGTYLGRESFNKEILPIINLLRITLDESDNNSASNRE